MPCKHIKPMYTYPIELGLCKFFGHGINQLQMGRYLCLYYRLFSLAAIPKTIYYNSHYLAFTLLGAVNLEVIGLQKDMTIICKYTILYQRQESVELVSCGFQKPLYS